MQVTDFITADYLNDFLVNFDAALAGQRVRTERHLRFRNNYYWCDITYHPARNSQGEIIGVSYNPTNITERILQQTNMAQHKTQLMQTAFLQSHELRRPVANIKGLLALLQSEGHLQNYWQMTELQKAVNELEEKIHIIVGFTDI